ncbi:multidrug effflux MFS transporter [Qipengyuania citrea]|uniref:Bcr/CflA family efflux transporter n=1 Tax=Qipengyuania citrea TaxID=225971 RepID=A0ABY4U1U5_9SPHN|nr:multidrug effflux MFS transporter [Qipengyuania citrea]USA60082.1 multidrug effflux MFS transporter [Qipengyuania citrea]
MEAQTAARKRSRPRGKAALETSSLSIPTPARLTRGRLALLASLAALGALATNIILPAFPAMGREFDVLPRDLALTLSVFFLVFAGGQLLVGPVTDAIGRRPVVLGGLIVFIGGSILCSLAPSFEWLIVGRGVQAAGACAAAVLARAIARDLYRGPELTRALALVMIAMAAAPGFSPAIGTAMSSLFGWRSLFVVVALAGALVTLSFLRTVGETLPPEARRSAHPLRTAQAYLHLSVDLRFISPALACSLIIGCLYTFFGAAPAIMMTNMGFSAADLSIFFAATVFIVFGAGLPASRLALRWDPSRIGIAGLSITLLSGIWLLALSDGAHTVPFLAAVSFFLGGMGLVNPIATAITLEPFGDRAGIASALLGFFQMACAAVGTWLISELALPPSAAFAVVVASGSMLAFIIFLPAVFRRSKPTKEPA